MLPLAAQQVVPTALQCAFRGGIAARGHVCLQCLEGNLVVNQVADEVGIDLDNAFQFRLVVGKRTRALLKP